MSTTFFESARRTRIGRLSVSISQTFVHVVNINQSPSEQSPLQRLSDSIALNAIHTAEARSGAPRCYPRTRVAVQSDIFSWIKSDDDTPSAKQILWLTGPAGAGKSAIAGTLAERCKEEGLLAAGFFFSVLSGSPSSHSKKHLIPTLAYQLIQNGVSEDLKGEILAAIQNKPTIFNERVEDQLEYLILHPLRTVGPRSPARRRKVIIIDGFDECEASPRDQLEPEAGNQWLKERAQREVLIALFDAVEDPAFPFRIIIASRPESAIQDIFKNNSARTKKIFLDEKYNPDVDIAHFVAGKLGEIRSRFKLPGSWPLNGDQVVRAMVRNASGQFVYAAVAMNYMEQSGGDPQTKLNRILRGNSGKHSAAERPFHRLDELYTCILRTSPRPLDAVKWIHAILELHSESGESIAMVRAFLESKPGEMEHLLGNLSSLLRTSGTFRVFHKSLLDYLGSKKRSGEAGLYVDTKTTLEFLRGRWYTLLKNKGPQAILVDEDREQFLQHYVGPLTMRYFLPSDEGRGYDPGDIKWWSEVASSRQLPQRDNRFDRIHDIVHETCRWFRCHPHCKIWRTTLRNARLGYEGFRLPNGFYFFSLLLSPLKGYT
ncbi:hypothetical protein NMY22_g12359 [Coprinellus aureogranulatus]|nr:hypothetical protein NMY22_g12359 [Coprinellus aureogranulatus]